MIGKYIFDENSNGDISENQHSKEKIQLNTLDDLKKLLLSMDISAEANIRYQNLCTVKHMKNIGCSQYIANSHINFNTLKNISERVEDAPAFTTYYVRLTGQILEV